MQQGWGQRPGQGYGPPPGYGPPHGGGYPGRGFGPPPKKGPSVATIALLTIGCTFALGLGSCVMCLAVGANKGPSRPEPASVAEPSSVDIREITRIYGAGEAAGDSSYKGETVTIAGGTTGEVKKDALGKPYVLVETGIPDGLNVQCFLANSGRATSLRRGQRITIRGQVLGLGLNSVMVKDCEVL